MKVINQGQPIPTPSGKPSAVERAIAAWNDPAKIKAITDKNPQLQKSPPPPQRQSLEAQLASVSGEATGQNHPVVELQAIEEASNPAQMPEQHAEAAAAEAEPAAVEAAPAPKAPETPSQSAELSSLIRREKALRQQKQTQEQEFARREAELKAREEKLNQFNTNEYIPKSRLKEDFLSVAAEAELSYDDITNQFLQQPQMDPATRTLVQRMQEEQRALREELKAFRAQSEERETAQYQSALNQIEADVSSIVDSDPEFETIKTYGKPAIKEVVKLIEATWKEEGRIMSNEEAVRLVEDHLVEEALKFAKLQKIQKRLAPPAPAEPESKAAAKPAANAQPKPTMTTLTNANSTPRRLSARERAILKAEGKL